MTAGTSLAVIVTDRISALYEKGEITERYYNPGALFDEVHLILSNDDSPPRDALELLTGTTNVHLHNVPAGRAEMLRAAVHRRLARRWVRQVTDLLADIRPTLVRC